MKTVQEVLDLALNSGRKIEAIKEIREHGFDGPGAFNGKWINEPQAGCFWGRHVWVMDESGAGYQGVTESGEPDGVFCRNFLGLKDAKDLVERLMAKATGTASTYDGDLRLELAQSRRNLVAAEQSEFKLSQDLTAERTAARVTEQRLGKALRQVEGLREKLADRNYRLGDMADENRSLERRVRDLEKLIADQAIDRNFEMRMGY